MLPSPKKTATFFGGDPFKCLKCDEPFAKEDKIKHKFHLIANHFKDLGTEFKTEKRPDQGETRQNFPPNEITQYT